VAGDRNVFNPQLNPAQQAGVRSFILERADDSATAAAASSNISSGAPCEFAGDWRMAAPSALAARWQKMAIIPSSCPSIAVMKSSSLAKLSGRSKPGRQWHVLWLKAAQICSLPPCKLRQRRSSNWSVTTRGVRPSSGAAARTFGRCKMLRCALCSDIPAPEDGRTPPQSPCAVTDWLP